ncbi:hypothetical protein AVEN_140959-1 [Araneus ventricosus]|uniref:IGFBP N-terminal domain-containing protein n=1 Tax=Araneus ventricosus TaxID=182803 RepID=A0A4Y2GDT6_ARAVE|nr:hypothetical protein AVEN_140959-1 [Araneus ventricosus]
MSETICCILLMIALLGGVQSLQEPFLCPEPDCETEECRHMERSGLCDEVAKGQLELTTQNCGCCFLCSDRKPGPAICQVDSSSVTKALITVKTYAASRAHIFR